MLCCALVSQNSLSPTAKFLFNERNPKDEFSKKEATLVGVSYTKDRFGNDNHAIYLHGNASSYINLGNYSELKPIAGTISMWVKVENPIWSGKGHMMNPFILTKCTKEDDFYESYVMCYYPETKKVATWCSRDSLKQIGMTSAAEFELFKWHHVAITYDDAFFCFYINGQLEAKLQKGFRTKFLDSDSVIVGVTANKKNNRFLNASVDDIEFYDKVLSEEEINQLYHAPNPNRSKIFIYWVLIALSFSFFIVILYFIIKYRLSITLKKEKQRLELYNIVLETELRVNRALMNPHFVFNSLNALQNFILKRDYEQANNYLVKFSKLMRRILESNMSDLISLEMEIELIKKYLEIEDLRFEENIKHRIHIDPAITPGTIHIPIMMIQPFVENAIWHGLLKKQGEKLLSLTFSRVENKYILCVIEDNGTGRKKQVHESLERKSLATGFVEQRLSLLNKMYKLNCTLSIEDKADQSGTIVRILLPILKK